MSPALLPIPFPRPVWSKGRGKRVSEVQESNVAGASPCDGLTVSVALHRPHMNRS